jgi:hypothetical protein
MDGTQGANTKVKRPPSTFKNRVFIGCLKTKMDLNWWKIIK